MEIEELWFATDKNMPQCEIALHRVEADGTTVWRFSSRATSDNYGKSIIDVSRKHLKDLHDAIEHELYPERFLPPVVRKTNFDQLFDHMAELGFTEEMIDRVLDRLQVAEDEQRKE